MSARYVDSIAQGRGYKVKRSMADTKIAHEVYNGLTNATNKYFYSVEPAYASSVADEIYDQLVAVGATHTIQTTYTVWGGTSGLPSASVFGCLDITSNQTTAQTNWNDVVIKGPVDSAVVKVGTTAVTVGSFLAVATDGSLIRTGTTYIRGYSVAVAKSALASGTAATSTGTCNISLLGRPAFATTATV